MGRVENQQTQISAHDGRSGYQTQAMLAEGNC